MRTCVTQARTQEQNGIANQEIHGPSLLTARKNNMADEKLAESVLKYRLMYDKKCKDFKDRNIKDKAWHAFAKEVGLQSS